MKISVILFPVIETIPFRIGIFSSIRMRLRRRTCAMANTPAILAEGLHKSYGKIHALDGLDLVAEEGSVLGVLGPNGAGKTTAVRILTTLTQGEYVETNYHHQHRSRFDAYEA